MLLGTILLLTALAPILPLPDPNATAPADRLKPVLTAGHLLGTDQLGRDILSRLLWGTRVSVAVGFAATFIAAGIGSAIGIVAGYAGGRIDNAMMRGIDMAQGRIVGIYDPHQTRLEEIEAAVYA